MARSPFSRSITARLGEIVADQADVALDAELLAVEGDDAGRLLAAVLQRVQAERGQRRRLRMAEDAEDAALLVELVVVEGVRPPIVHAIGPRSGLYSGGGASSCRSSWFWSSGADPRRGERFHRRRVAAVSAPQAARAPVTASSAAGVAVARSGVRSAQPLA